MLAGQKKVCAHSRTIFPSGFGKNGSLILVSQGHAGWGSLWPGSVPLRVGGGREAHRPCFAFPLQLQYPSSPSSPFSHP